ncbi:MAG: acyl-CoA dehydrogenase family protein [Hyphomonadaceae bacterium]
MNFLLSDDQLALQAALRTLLQDKCEPRRVHATIDAARAYDDELWSDLRGFGAASIIVPEAYGGLGLDMIDLALVAEALGEFAAPAPFLGHALATLAIIEGGSEAQKQTWLPKLATGEVLATVALGERGETWTPASWRIEAGASLSGEKVFVPNAGEAGLFVIGVAGGGLVLAEKGEAVAARRIEAVDLTRPLDHVTFSSSPCEPLANAGAADRLIDAACVLLAADAYGGAWRCVAMSSDYAKMREQFGAPIGSFQGLKHQLANMAIEAETARGLYWYAAHAFDAIREKAPHAAAQAKAHVCDAYVQCARDTVEAHGGIGFTWEHDAHLYLKRAMFNSAWLGAPMQHRARAAQLAGW